LPEEVFSWCRRRAPRIKGRPQQRNDRSVRSLIPAPLSKQFQNSARNIDLGITRKPEHVGLSDPVIRANDTGPIIQLAETQPPDERARATTGPYDQTTNQAHRKRLDLTVGTDADYP